MNKKPLILVVNDDGHEAKGLWALVRAASPHGEVVVVVPDGSRSGMSHAITMDTPLYLTPKINSEGIPYYCTNGTPVDCVKLGERIVLKDREIDLVLSGINHGSNAATSLMYSGTMAAAIEAAFESIPAMGISLLDYNPNADFTAAESVASHLIRKLLERPFPPRTCLNVNIPVLPLEKIKGYKVVKQAMNNYWYEDFETRTNPAGQTYYWMNGYLVSKKEDEGSCLWALNNGYVAIQPVQFDWTAHHHIQTFQFLEK